MVCELEPARAVEPLRSHTETAVCHHCFRQKKVDLRTFRRQEMCHKSVIIHERATNVCILYTCIDNVPKQCAELLYT